MSSNSTDLFLEATGGNAPLRITVESASEESQFYSNAGWERQFKFEQPFVLVGSHALADLRLDNDAISRRQVYLQYVDGRLFATHLSTRVPTLWGSTPQPSGWINRHSVLRIGPYLLRFNETADSENAHPSLIDPLSAESYVGPPVTLDLKGGRRGANKAIIDRVLTLVGSSPVCKLRLMSSRVSGVHCSLVRTSQGLWVVDLASREGIKVNGQMVRSALLAEGDLLEIGGRNLKVNYKKTAARRTKSAKPAKPVKAAASETPPPPEPASEFSVSTPADPPPSDIIDLRSAAPTEEPPSGVDSGIIHLEPETGLARTDSNEDMLVPISVLEPVFDKLNELQAQSFQQFQDMMNAMVNAFGNMFMEHREFVGQEMEKLERLARSLAEIRPAMPLMLPAPAAPTSPVAASTPSTSEPAVPPSRPAEVEANRPPETTPRPARPTPKPAAASTNGASKVPQGEEVHLWLARRIGELSKRRNSRWDNLVAALRSKIPGGSG